jgi:hypothetical protein
VSIWNRHKHQEYQKYQKTRDTIKNQARRMSPTSIVTQFKCTNINI